MKRRHHPRGRFPGRKDAPDAPVPGPRESPVPAAATGTLHVVATPIGNVEDLTPRALRILSATPVLATEDTRHTGVLLKRLGVPHGDRRFVACHDANEARVVPALLDVLRSGTDVALVSDAGTPLVSDPGYRLVAAARAAGIPVVPVPGPCAAVAALSASGLPSDRFTFFGFLPARPGRRARMLDAVVPAAGTCIFYVPARSLAKVLDEIAARIPAARVVVARELTKLFEQFLSGTPAEVRAALPDVPRGEVTLLVHPGDEPVAEE
jgi:16S rRNA (cytidine1402-2'-O)-methyltransferase